MASHSCLFVLVVSVLLVTVTCILLPIVSMDRIEDLREINLTCDANRIPQRYYYEQSTNLAEVVLYKLDYINGRHTWRILYGVRANGTTFKEDLPTARDWEFLHGSAAGPDNLDAMFVTLVIHDPTCEDAGTYWCQLKYPIPNSVRKRVLQRKEVIRPFCDY